VTSVPLRFRLYATILALLLVVAISARAQDDQLKTASKQELDIIKVLVAQEDAWNKGDLQAFIQGYKNSPDTLFITHQVFRGVDGMIDEYRHNYPTKAAMGTLGFSELEVHPLDEKFAVVLGKYHLDRGKKDGGNVDGIFSLVFEKTDQGWKIIVDHTT
jgi:ketosteroid isomerase-like protein